MTHLRNHTARSCGVYSRDANWFDVTHHTNKMKAKYQKTVSKDTKHLAKFDLYL